MVYDVLLSGPPSRDVPIQRVFEDAGLVTTKAINDLDLFPRHGQNYPYRPHHLSQKDFHPTPNNTHGTQPQKQPHLLHVTMSAEEVAWRHIQWQPESKASKKYTPRQPSHEKSGSTDGLDGAPGNETTSRPSHGTSEKSNESQEKPRKPHRSGEAKYSKHVRRPSRTRAERMAEDDLHLTRRKHSVGETVRGERLGDRRPGRRQWGGTSLGLGILIFIASVLMVECQWPIDK